MSAAQDLKQLAEEIAHAYEERNQFNKKLKSDVLAIKQQTGDLRQNASDLLKYISEKHLDMVKSLRAKLNQFNAKVAAEENRRLKEADEYKNQRKSDLTQMKQDTQNFLEEAGNAHAEMGNHLKSELKKFMDELLADSQQFKAKAKEDLRLRYEEIGTRKTDVNQLKQSTKDFLKEVEKDYNEMSAKLQSELQQFMADLSAFEESRKTSAKSDLSQRLNDIAINRANVSKSREDVCSFLKELDNTQKSMGNELRASLNTFVVDLKTSEKERKSNVSGLLTSIRTELKDMTQAWNGVIGSMKQQTATIQSQSTTKAPKDSKNISAPKDEIKDNDKKQLQTTPLHTGDIANSGMVKEKSENISAAIPIVIKEEVVKSEVIKEEIAQSEKKKISKEEKKEVSGTSNNNDDKVKTQIMNLLKQNPNGLKTTQLAELLNISQLHIVISIMRNLQESEQIRKEGQLYFFK